MDHHKMGEKAESKFGDGHSDHQEAAAAGAIEATGKVNSVDVAGHSVNVTHDPLKPSAGQK